MIFVAVVAIVLAIVVELFEFHIDLVIGAIGLIFVVAVILSPISL